MVMGVPVGVVGMSVARAGMGMAVGASAVGVTVLEGVDAD